MSKYTFVTKSTQLNPTPFSKPIPSSTSYYQISLHPNPKTKLYHIRKFKIDENDNITKMKEYNVPKSQYEQLIKSKKPHQYKLFSVLNLNNTNYPQKGDILLLKSNILSNPTSYTGYASF